MKTFGGFVFKTHGGPYQRVGLPDLIGCIDGQFVGIEVKRPDRKDRVTPLQRQTLQKIAEAGGIAFVATSEEEAIQKLTIALYMDKV